MSKSLREALLFVKQQHEWLVDLQSVLAEREQKYKILYNKLKYQLMKEMKNEGIGAFMTTNGRSNNNEQEKRYNIPIHSFRTCDSDELSDGSDYPYAEEPNHISERRNVDTLETEKKTLLDKETELNKEQTIRGRRLVKQVKRRYKTKPHKTHNCKLCSMKFRYRSGLIRHMYKHSDERPYKCLICGKAFKRKKDLDNHNETPTGEKPYGCFLCPKKFCRRSHLTIHIRQHVGEKNL